MAGKQSWAEKRWWRGTVFDWMGVLLLLLLIFVGALVSVPFLLLRHTVSSGLQDYYLTVYRSTCASWERRTAALPYVLQSNGVRRLPVCVGAHVPSAAVARIDDAHFRTVPLRVDDMEGVRLCVDALDHLFASHFHSAPPKCVMCSCWLSRFGFVMQVTRASAMIPPATQTSSVCVHLGTPRDARYSTRSGVPKNLVRPASS
jgi:hypothetical protein